MRRHSQLTVEMRAEADMELEHRRDSLAFMQNSSAAQRVERSACGSHQLFIIRKRR